MLLHFGLVFIVFAGQLPRLLLSDNSGHGRGNIETAWTFDPNRTDGYLAVGTDVDFRSSLAIVDLPCLS